MYKDDVEILEIESLKLEKKLVMIWFPRNAVILSENDGKKGCPITSERLDAFWFRYLSQKVSQDPEKSWQLGHIYKIYTFRSWWLLATHEWKTDNMTMNSQPHQTANKLVNLVLQW